ncbi:hypothetical protein HZY88_04870 [Aerococcaceae bacterium DSM 111176]|nr:hypothetical protein [Aerococcaceae bacterium DSM 111176]
MRVLQQANCKNAPKNQKVADMAYAILAGDESFVNEKFADGLASIKLPPLDDVDEISVDIAISHGKSASCLCSYELEGQTRHIVFYLEFTTHKAEAYASIIVTYN